MLATGGSAEALHRIVKLCNAETVGFMFYIELTPLKGKEKLQPLPVYSLVEVEAY